METLKIALVQNHLAWEDINANLQSFDEMLHSNTSKADVWILPEMFTTGFSNAAEKLAVDMESEPVQWMKHKAQQLDALIIGSMIIRQNNQFFNRLLAVFPDGNILHYDKRHLFSLMHENDFYNAGNAKLTFTFRGWTITPLICYDLRFPVWCRNTAMADLMIFVANWPEKRHFHWTTLLKARAIENQCYIAGVNRIGEDNNGIPHNGQSALYDFWGNETGMAGNLKQVLSVEINKTTLMQHRERFSFWKDSDTFNIEI